MLDLKTVTILGGTGFIGRYLVKEFAKTGVKINLVSRYPDEALFLKVTGSVGQINLVQADLLKEPEKLAEIISVSDVVVNLVGSDKLTAQSEFHNYYAKLPELIARYCKEYKVKKFIHVSANSRLAKSKFSAAKHLGENLVREEFPETIIVRPTMVFGLEDNFCNKIIQLSKILPIFPLATQNNKQIQPVYVNDLAKALSQIIIEPHNRAQIYCLAGPDIFTLPELVQKISLLMGKKRRILFLPQFVLLATATIIELFNCKIITKDYLKRLQEENITGKNQLTFFDMHMQLHNIDEILPLYNGVYKTSCYFQKN
ncbi:MAG: complex I NDUFA9 subunit family protein [Rickettsiales bacterium]